MSHLNLKTSHQRTVFTDPFLSLYFFIFHLEYLQFISSENFHNFLMWSLMFGGRISAFFLARGGGGCSRSAAGTTMKVCFRKVWRSADSWISKEPKVTWLCLVPHGLKEGHAGTHASIPPLQYRDLNLNPSLVFLGFTWKKDSSVSTCTVMEQRWRMHDVLFPSRRRKCHIKWTERRCSDNWMQPSVEVWTGLRDPSAPPEPLCSVELQLICHDCRRSETPPSRPPKTTDRWFIRNGREVESADGRSQLELKPGSR